MNCAICGNEIERIQGADGEAVWAHTELDPDTSRHLAQPVREVML